MRFPILLVPALIAAVPLASAPLASASPAPDAQADAKPRSFSDRRPNSRPLPPPFAEGDCPSAPRRAKEAVLDAVPRKLGELPPGRLELAVLREVGGCPVPAVIRTGIGGPQPRRTP